MKKLFVCLFLASSLFAQQHFTFPFQDPNLPVEKRAEDLVSRMTLEEKVSQMVFNAPAIERLGIPKYNWWNECLHGVARNGLATVFPQAIGLAATWNKELIHKVGSAISDEARAKYNDAVKKGSREIYQGLTFWSPNINIFRDPRWGRGMETYGEDPFLTGKLAVQFIKGIQGDDPKYLKAIATVKHFAVHSGPEPERHSFDANISDYDLRETYLPAFKMSVQEGNVQSLMCAYNSLHGKACCSNDPLLDKILRNEWGFKGYVVSDCWAISDIYRYHNEAKDAAEASALSVRAGTDLECGDSFPKLLDAIRKGLVDENEINISMKRLMEARIKLGMFDPPELVPFTKINMSKVDSKQNRALALQVARESIVLLKNEKNILPLNKNLNTIAVIGPNADDEESLLGNYHGTPAEAITPLMGIIKKVGKSSKIIFERGCDVAENMSSLQVIPAKFLFTSVDKKHNGLTGEYFDNIDWHGKPTIVRIDKQIDFKWLREFPGNTSIENKSVRWTGYLIPEKSGEYNIGGYGFNKFNIYINDSLVAEFDNDHDPYKTYSEIKLNANQPYKIRIDFIARSRYAQMKLIWSVPENNSEERAIAAAKKADAVVMFMGLSPRLEGEEMKVPVKGFDGGDRQTLELPEIQTNLIKKISSTGKPVVLVLLNGSAVSVNWENENIPAIVESWYGGEAAGSAIADVIFGDYNPAGRLPVTFYKSAEQLPDFRDYSMRSGNSSKSLGRTYRYFEGEPLYPFGYGLSYTKFAYNNLHVSKNSFCDEDAIKLYVDVTNTGKVSGDEVVQLYVKGSVSNTNRALKTLKGFERITLKPNQTKTVQFIITKETLQEYFGEKGFAVEKGEHSVMVGSSSANTDLKEIIITVE
jgi:beta-glucosidase